MQKLAFQQQLVAEDACDLAQAFGVTHFYVDISVPENAIDTWSQKRIQALLVRSKGLQPIVHGNGVNPLSHKIPQLRESAIDYATKEMTLASQLSASYIVHGGQAYTTGSMESALEQAMESFSESFAVLQKNATELGVDIWVENLANFESHYPFMNVLSRIESFDYLLERFPETKIIFDVGHYHVGKGEHAQFINKFMNNIVAVSLSDNDSRRDMHAPLGFGTVQWDILRQAFSSEWGGVFVFETKSPNPVDDYEFYFQAEEVAA